MAFSDLYTVTALNLSSCQKIAATTCLNRGPVCCLVLMGIVLGNVELDENLAGLVYACEGIVSKLSQLKLMSGFAPWIFPTQNT